MKRVAQTGFAAHLRIVEDYDPSLPQVWGNRDQLVQILLNLVKNAAEAVDPMGGEIVLSTAYHHGVRIAVPGSKERVHLPLRGQRARQRPRHPAQPCAPPVRALRHHQASGQGLGLALVAKLVADQGGLIDCDCRPGRTIFRLSLAMPPTGERRAEAARAAESIAVRPRAMM